MNTEVLPEITLGNGRYSTNFFIIEKSTELFRTGVV